MRVYLYGKRGGRGNFKITTAEVYSNLHGLIEEAMTEMTDGIYSGKRYSEESLLSVLRGWSTPTMYWMDIDSGKPAKKVTKKMWEDAVKEYADEHADKFAKFLLLQRKL